MPAITTSHLARRMTSEEKRDLIIVIILIFLATVGVFCGIILLLIWQRKRKLKQRNQTLMQHEPTSYNPVTTTQGPGGMGTEDRGLMGGMLGRQSKYQRLEDDVVWSADMNDGRRSIGGEERGPLMAQGHRNDEAPWDAETYNQTLLARQAASRESLRQS